MRIAKEAWPKVALALLIGLPAGLWLHPLVTLPFLLFALFTLWFFRDPERTAPREPGLLVCPADGRIIRDGPGTVSIFMNVFNVHVCRTPLAGRVIGADHHRGRFLAAWHEDAPTANERLVIRVRQDETELVFTLIAGLVARRIVGKVVPGQELGLGERVGLIQFGSRVDVELPAGYRPAVAVGDRVRAGETVLARRQHGPGE